MFKNANRFLQPCQFLISLNRCLTLDFDGDIRKSVHTLLIKLTTICTAVGSSRVVNCQQVGS